MRNKLISLDKYAKIMIDSASQLKYDLVIICILGGVIYLLALACAFNFWTRMIYGAI